MNAVRTVLHRFGVTEPVGPIDSLRNAGGMSGAALWRIDTHSGPLCLRRWPQDHPSHEHLVWIHSRMIAARSAGCDFVPKVVRCANGQTFVNHASSLWELTTWQPGRADFHLSRTTGRLTAAMRALARFHLATIDRRLHVRRRPSPGLAARRRLLEQTDRQRLSDLRAIVQRSSYPRVQDKVERILDGMVAGVERALAVVRLVGDRPTRLQACLRDIWHDHLLFQGDRLTGLVDYGAMRVESPLGDIARLLGSLIGNDSSLWTTGLESYGTLVPLERQDRELLAAFDVSNIVLSGLNWIDWLYVQRRFFEDPMQVESRLAEIDVRLDQFVKHDWPFEDIF